MGRKLILALGLIALVVSVAACSRRSDSLEPLSLESVHTESVETSLPVTLRLAEGWHVREASASGIWVITLDAELMLSASSSDYVSRLAHEASLLEKAGLDVTGPLQTELFGKPAISYTVTGPGFTRLFVASADWQVGSQAAHAFDLRQASEIAAMLGPPTNFPAPGPR